MTGTGLAGVGSAARQPSAAVRPTTRTSYEICDASGVLVALHQREDRPDGTKDAWWEQPGGGRGLGDVRTSELPLYGIHVLGNRPSSRVVIVEGEKARDALAAAGVVAVATVTGAAGCPSPRPLAELTGQRVTLWPDHDEHGRAHMRKLAQALLRIAASVCLAAWAEAPAKGDAADFIFPGLGAAELHSMALQVEAGAPPYAPTGPHTLDDLQAVLDAALPVTVRMPAAQRGADWAESNRTPAAQTSIPSGAESNLPFRTAREIATEVPEAIRWHLPGFIAAGAITELVGKIKAAGKTTFVTHAIRAIVEGEPFIGRSTLRTGVVYLTEQSPSSFRVALRRAALLDRDDVSVLFWRDTAGVRWREVVEAAVEECERRQAGILVVDTLPRFAGLRGDAENNAGDADAAMAPLQVAAADGLGVIVVRHERKAGGEVGDSGRGSSAFGGAVDIVLALKRGEGATRPTVRVLQALSRFDETPGELVIELTDEGYVALGDEAAVARAEARQRIRAALRANEDQAATLQDLVTSVGGSRSTVQRVLEDLVQSGEARRIGTGKRGDPYRFCAGAGAGPETVAAPSGMESGQRATDEAPAAPALASQPPRVKPHDGPLGTRQAHGQRGVPCPTCDHPMVATAAGRFVCTFAPGHAGPRPGTPPLDAMRATWETSQ